MNASMGLRTQAPFFGVGSSARTGGLKDQWSSFPFGAGGSFASAPAAEARINRIESALN
jgi:hypothetical protein